MKTIIYFPSEEEKDEINECCAQMIDCMDGLTFEQKVMALRILAESFQERYSVQKVRVHE